MGEFQELVDDYRRRHGSSYRSLSLRLGLSAGTVSGWFTRDKTNPPPADVLRDLAIEMQTPYKRLLDAALHEYGYLPEARSGHVETPAKKTVKGSNVTQMPLQEAKPAKPIKKAARPTPGEKPKKPPTNQSNKPG